MDDDVVKPSAKSPEFSLRGKFLLASPTLVEPSFTRTVVLIVRHDLDGALGLIMNRPLGVSLDEACSDEVEAARGVGVPLFHGGPCPGPLVAVHNLARLAREEAQLPDDEDEDVLSMDSDLGEDSGSEELSQNDQADDAIAPGVWFCSRREALEALMRHTERAFRDPVHEGSEMAVKFVAGYAGWSSGQLENELQEGAWQILDADAADVYAGGDPNHPDPPPQTSLPPGAVGMLGLLSPSDEVSDPTAALAAGIRQWVRLSTKANLRTMVDPAMIPDDPSLN